jgi:ABC-type glycerol-3-phosphate transport system substrate-binding protein
MKFKKFSILLIPLIIIAYTLSGCGGDTAGTPDTQADPAQDEPADSGSAKFTEDGKRIITIGTWYDRYYVSKHTSIEDDPGLSDPDTAQIKLDRLRAIEKKYDIELRYVNLTFDGVKESIDTSIPAGAPEVDVYETDLQFGVPAVLEGYGIPLSEIGYDEAALKELVAIQTLTLPGQDSPALFSPSSAGSGRAYPLAFNLDMIKDAGLENPQDLYDKGEWTWDKWREYLKKLTKDTDDDGKTDVYGYSGWWPNLLTNLLMSNGTGIAISNTEGLSKPASVEVIDFIDTIYHEDKTARPWDDSDWNINNQLYAQGLSGFWIGADWVFDSMGGKVGKDNDVDFEIGVVPWPTGPSGDQKTNFMSQPNGNWYFIPEGTAEPKVVYDVIADWINWYDSDTEVGLNDTWSHDMYMSDRNFDYAKAMGERVNLDMWQDLNVDFNLSAMLTGGTSPQELIDAGKTAFQDALDKYNKE